jgi:nitrate reductase beta subunit
MAHGSQLTEFAFAMRLALCALFHALCQPTEIAMPKVHNWQLGREMEFPYEAAFPKRQFAFVFNINRCIACQSCTMACKSTWTFNKGQEHMWWANVETKPYGGYPQFWDMKILKLLEEANPGGQIWNKANGTPQFEGMTIFEAAKKKLTPESARVLGYLPEDHEWNSPNIYEDNPKGVKGKKDELDKEGTALPVHKTWFFYLARICNHCTYPACLAACPRKAIYKRPEDGIVLLDQAQCRGYRKRAFRKNASLAIRVSRAPIRKPRASRWKRAAWRRASDKSVCRAW